MQAARSDVANAHRTRVDDAFRRAREAKAMDEEMRRRMSTLRNDRRMRRRSEQAQLHRMRLQGRAERRWLAQVANPSPSSPSFYAENDDEAGPSNMAVDDDEEDDDDDEEDV